MPKFANLPALTVATLAAADLFAVDQAAGPTLKSIRGDGLLQGALVASGKKLFDENTNEWMTFVTTTSAINQVTVTNSAAGNGVGISATGDDAAVSLKLDSKSTGTIALQTSGTGNVTSAVPIVVTTASATAIAVGRQGSTNPVLTVDASTATVVTGLKVKGAAAAAGLALSVTSSGAAEPLTIDALGTGSITLGNVSTGNVQIGATANALVLTNATGALTLTTAAAAALSIGRQGATAPAFSVDASAGTAVTGVKVTAAATGGTTIIAVTSSGTNEKLALEAKGSGGIVIGGTSTGLISLGRGSVNTVIFSGTKTSLATQNITPTAAQLLGGYVSHASTTGAGTATLDTAANIDSAIAGVATGDQFECTYANTGSQTVTITTAAGLSLKGTVAVPSGKNATLLFARTGAGAWDVVIVVSA